MSAVFARTPPPPVPYCVIGLRYGPIVRTLRVPEEWIPRVTLYGWEVIVKDSDVPLELGQGQYWKEPKVSAKPFFPPQQETD